MAEKDERYEQTIHAKAGGVKKSQPVQGSGKTVKTVASDVPTMSKLAVKRFRQAGNTVRRLGENLGEMERDTLDLDRRSLIVLGEPPTAPFFTLTTGAGLMQMLASLPFPGHLHIM